MRRITAFVMCVGLLWVGDGSSTAAEAVQAEPPPGANTAPGGCASDMGTSSQLPAAFDLPDDEQPGALAERLVGPTGEEALPGEPALTVAPPEGSDATFISRRGPTGELQIAGAIAPVGGVEAFDFDHRSGCGVVSQLSPTADRGVEITVDIEGQPSTVIQVGAPWAIDAAGRELPTWYEVAGTAIRQFVDTSEAVGRVFFDPTYSAYNCLPWGAWSDLSASDYLDMIVGADVGACPIGGMFWAANDYWPVWAFETNVANDYGKVPVRQDGGCSWSPDTGWAWDFQLPCKAHDYCYDLRRAGFSGTVSDNACDDTFYWLMEAHCDDRVLSGDCRIVRDSYHLAVSAPGVVTEPSPGIVEIVSYGSNKCIDVEGPSTADGAPLQQWGCLGATNQRFRIHPASGHPGEFTVRPTNSNKCTRTLAASILQETCADVGLQRVWIDGTHVSSYTPHASYIRGAASGRCWNVPSSSMADGTNLSTRVCDDFDPWNLWLLDY